MTTEFTLQIWQEFEQYLVAKQRNEPEFQLADKRNHLFERVMNEEPNVFSSVVFMDLIDDEQEALLSDTYEPIKKSGLVAITRAIMKQQGKEDMEDELIKKILHIEYPPKDLKKLFYNASSEWFVDILLGNAETSEVRDYLIRYMGNNVEVFPNFEKSYLNNSPDFRIQNSIAEEKTRNIAQFHRVANLKRRMRKICISFALFNYAKGNSIDAKFFLMRAVMLNGKDVDGYMLVKLLNKVILIEE